MCFYDHKIFSCGDFKWSYFRQQCGAEHRTGQTCSLKLVMSTVHVNHKCELCERLETKIGRFWKEEQRNMRWKTESPQSNTSERHISQTRAASIGLAKNILNDLRHDILKLQNERECPFASFDCENGSEDEGGVIAVRIERISTLPSLKTLFRYESTGPDLGQGPEPPFPASNMLILKILESETAGTSYGKDEDDINQDDVSSNDQVQERLAFMLTIRLFYAAFESFISLDGTIRLPSGNILSRSRYPDISPTIFKYIHGLKTDLTHAGLSSQLSEADAEIEEWLPMVLEALRRPENNLEDAPRQLQRLIATLRDIQYRIRRDGFTRVQYEPPPSIEQRPDYSDSQTQQSKYRPLRPRVP